MDYRFREYYLVHFNILFREYFLKHLKTNVPSLKMHKPYNHMAYEKYADAEYDGKWWRLTKLQHVDMMLSCNKKDACTLERELNKLNRPDDCMKRCKFYRLTKGFCGQ